MKKGFILIALVNLFIFKSSAQNRLLEAIQIEEGIYVDRTEVNVASWLSYYYWIYIHEGYNAAQSVLPDSNLVEPELWKYINTITFIDYIDNEAPYSHEPIGYFRKNCPIDERFEGRIFLRENRYCSLLNLPMSGVSYDQVIAFCKWRTEMEGGYEFSLPTPEEWLKIAKMGLSLKEVRVGIRDSLNGRHIPMYNYYFESCCPNCKELGTIFGAGMFYKDAIGLHDFFGNVSEMTSVRGVSKGGNYLLYSNQCHVDSNQYYSKGERWLGFRCIAKKMDPKLNQIVDNDQNLQNDKLFDVRDNKSYLTVKVGNQIWMAENLAFKPESGKFWAYDDQDKYVRRFGYLYSWETAMKACPVGWRLPSKIDFEVLLSELETNKDQLLYDQLRPWGKSSLNIQSVGLHISALFAPSIFVSYTLNSTILWSSSEASKNKNACGLAIHGDGRKVYIGDYWKKTDGLPVRCLKDGK
jgi:uncharacterized protein (TIGR02145 family)